MFSQYRKFKLQHFYSRHFHGIIIQVLFRISVYISHSHYSGQSLLVDIPLYCNGHVERQMYQHSALCRARYLLGCRLVCMFNKSTYTLQNLIPSTFIPCCVCWRGFFGSNVNFSTEFFFYTFSPETTYTLTLTTLNLSLLLVLSVCKFTISTYTLLTQQGPNADHTTLGENYVRNFFLTHFFCIGISVYNRGVLKITQGFLF